MVDCPDLHVRDNQTINCNNLDFNAKKVSISDASSMMFSPQVSGVQHVHLSWWFLWNISAERSPGRDDGSDPRDRAGWADAWRSHHVYINPPKIAIFTVVSGVCFIYWRCGFQSTSRNGGSQKDVGYLGPQWLPGRCKMPPPSCRVHDSSSTSEWKVSWQSWAFEQRPRENKITVKIGVVKIGQNYQFFFLWRISCRCSPKLCSICLLGLAVSQNWGSLAIGFPSKWPIWMILQPPFVWWYLVASEPCQHDSLIGLVNVVLNSWPDTILLDCQISSRLNQCGSNGMQVI